MVRLFVQLRKQQDWRMSEFTGLVPDEQCNVEQVKQRVQEIVEQESLPFNGKNIGLRGIWGVDTILTDETIQQYITVEGSDLCVFYVQEEI